MTKQINWKEKFHDAINICQVELKKATSIGKKMLVASKTNSELKDQYENIGRYVVKAIDEDRLHWDDEEAKKLKEIINESEAKLKEIEKEVSDIKKA